MGYIFHTLCELMPLFAGLSVATEEMTTEKLPAMTNLHGMGTLPSTTRRSAL